MASPTMIAPAVFPDFEASKGPQQAARRFGEVISTDCVPALLEAGRARANAEGLAVHFQEADAERLPFDAASFDVVVSTFGVMFTPNQSQAAAELTRSADLADGSAWPTGRLPVSSGSSSA